MSAHDSLDDSADRSQDGSVAPAVITAEQWQHWRSEWKGFFTEIRAKLNRVAASLEHSKAASESAPATAAAPPAQAAPPTEASPAPASSGERSPDGTKSVREHDSAATADPPGSHASPPSEPRDPGSVESSADDISGSLERLEEIRRQLAARLQKS